MKVCPPDGNFWHGYYTVKQRCPVACVTSEVRKTIDYHLPKQNNTKMFTVEFCCRLSANALPRIQQLKVKVCLESNFGSDFTDMSGTFSDYRQFKYQDSSKVECQYLGKYFTDKSAVQCSMIRLPIPISGLKLCWWTIGRTSITKHWRFLIIWNRFKRSECRATLPGGRPGRQTEGRKERVKYHYNRSTTA